MQSLSSSSYHEILLDRLNENLGGQMGGDLPDLHVLGEGGAPGQVVLVDQLHQGLGSLVDHGVSHNPRLTKGGSQGQAGEDVPEAEDQVSSIDINIMSG